MLSEKKIPGPNESNYGYTFHVSYTDHVWCMAYQVCCITSTLVLSLYIYVPCRKIARFVFNHSIFLTVRFFDQTSLIHHDLFSPFGERAFCLFLTLTPLIHAAFSYMIRESHLGLYSTTSAKKVIIVMTDQI